MKIMARLDNPFVVPLMFAFEAQRHVYLVMSYIPGRDLQSLLTILIS